VHVSPTAQGGLSATPPCANPNTKTFRFFTSSDYRKILDKLARDRVGLPQRSAAILQTPTPHIWGEYAMSVDRKGQPCL
jgi:hypothetical protein